MHLNIKNIIIVFALLLFSCSKDILINLDHTKNGNLTIMSAFIVVTVKDNPVGKHIVPIIATYKKDSVLSKLGDTLFGTPLDINHKFKGSSSTMDGRFGHYVRFYFTNDTCTSLFLEDSVVSPNHFNACIELISENYGKPTYDHYSPGGKFIDERIDHYCWQVGDLKIQALRWGWYNGYYIEIEDVKREAILRKLFADSTSHQPL